VDLLGENLRIGESLDGVPLQEEPGQVAHQGDLALQVQQAHQGAPALQVLQEPQGGQANQVIRVILALQADNHIVQSRQKAVTMVPRLLHALDQLQAAITVVVEADRVAVVEADRVVEKDID